MKNYKDKECERQQTLIKSTGLFDGISGGGRFMGKERPFVLTDGSHNLYAFIREEAIKYFRDNNIGWWGGSRPSGASNI